MKKSEELKDRYMDELLRSEARGTGADEALLQEVEEAIEAAESPSEVAPAIRKSRAPMAWAAMLVISGAGVLGYLAMDWNGDLAEPGAANVSSPQQLAADERARKERALAALDAELQAQEALVEERRRVLDTIVQAVGIPYVEGRQAAIPGASGESASLMAERELYRQEREKQQLAIQVETLGKLTGDDQMKYAAGLVLPDNAVPGLYGDYLATQRELEGLKASGLGNEHPEVRRREAKSEQLHADLDRSVASLRTDLETQEDLVGGRLDEMRQVVGSRRDQAGDKALESHDYVDAKRGYEIEQARLQNMKLAHASQRMGLKGQLGELAQVDSFGRPSADEVPGAVHPEPAPPTPVAPATPVPPVMGPVASVTRENDAASDPSRPTEETRILAEEVGTLPSGVVRAPAVLGRDLPAGMSRKSESSTRALSIESDAHVRPIPARPVPSRPPVEKPSARESYAPLADQAWKASAEEPLSTFSVDVDTASYTNIRRMLNAGQQVPADAVRVEECINYFDYDYAGPEKETPFATHVDLATCPWAEGHLLLKVGLKGYEVPAHLRPASNLVFLLDVSGSMQSPDKLPLVVESMKILVEELDERDRVSIVVYAGAEGVVLDSTMITEDGRGALLASLNNLRAGGSTNGGAGIKRAYEIAQKQFVRGGVNRVILCTDGDFNVGTTGKDDLVQLVKSRAQEGVSLSVLGFGTGNINDAMLEAITNDGNGNYFYLDSIREGRKVFLEDLTGTLVTIAKDVKLQLEFNPAKVEHYRLIGYANRQLKKEDFNNDAVDAGDIGAGHTVTALYEIVPVGSSAPVRPAVDPLRYEAREALPPSDLVRPAAASKEWLTVKLRYKMPDADVSTKIEVPVEGPPIPWDDESADFNLAAGVALFGMKLRNSQYIGNADWELVHTLAKRGQGHDIHGHRGEFLKLVEMMQARSLQR